MNISKNSLFWGAIWMAASVLAHFSFERLGRIESPEAVGLGAAHLASVAGSAAVAALEIEAWGAARAARGDEEARWALVSTALLVCMILWSCFLAPGLLDLVSPPPAAQGDRAASSRAMPESLEAMVDTLLVMGVFASAAVAPVLLAASALRAARRIRR